MKVPSVSLITVFWLSTLSACSRDDEKPHAQTLSTQPSGLEDATLESPVTLGRWQGETLGNPESEQPCVLNVEPSHGRDASQLLVQLSVAPHRHVYTTISREAVTEIFSGRSVVVKMRPQSVSDWVHIVTNKLATIAYARFVAAYEFLANLVRRDVGAAGTVIIRSAQIEWVVLTSSCHFETQWDLKGVGSAMGLEVEGVQSLVCQLRNAPPTTFSLDRIRCHQLRLSNPGR